MGSGALRRRARRLPQDRRRLADADQRGFKEGEEVEGGVRASSTEITSPFGHYLMQSCTDARPIIILTAAVPAFRSRVPIDAKLQCSNCGTVLIDGYWPDCFIEIGIKCFGCKEITHTPKLEEGEILPRPIAVFGEPDKYAINRPIDYHPSIACTTDEQIKISNEACSPKKTETQFDLTEQAIQTLAERFAEISGHSLAARTAELSRYQSAGRSGSKQLPFEWAIWKITECLKKGAINIEDTETNVALSRIYLFREIDSAWRHHPRFLKIAAEFSNPQAFFHTTGQFIIASFFFEKGVRLGFSVHQVDGQPKPDLYLRPGADKKFFLEFKTPSSLIWEKDMEVADATVRKNVRSILKNSGQINKSRPGGMVLMGNHPAPDIFEKLEREVRSFLDHKGRDKRHLAGVVAMHYSSTLSRTDKGLSENIQFKIQMIANKYCGLPQNPFNQT